MLDSSRASTSRIFLILGSTAIFLLLLATPSRAQLAAAQPASAVPPQKENPVTEAGKAMAPRSSETPPVLRELNSALQGLVAKVSPAVVQVLVTGYGAIEENNRSETALVARQHAVGSGVIVDSDGYIMTNAHVVEGAHRIRVVLPMPSLDVVRSSRWARSTSSKQSLLAFTKSRIWR
jgi:S1-C subfamily serine protease